jgi:hypothetical protein
MNKSYLLSNEGNGSHPGLPFSTLEEAMDAAKLRRVGSSILEWAERAALPGAPRAFTTPGFIIVECDGS